MPVVNLETGEVWQAQVLVAVPAASSYTYAGAHASQALTKRDREVLRLIGEVATNHEIAERLFLGESPDQRQTAMRRTQPLDSPSKGRTST